MTQPASEEAFLVAFLLAADSFVWPHDPYAMGAYEFTRRDDPFPEAAAALDESISAHGVPTSARIVRMQTFVLSQPRREAIRIARLHAKETLSLMAHITYQHVDTSGLQRAGYTHDLRRGIVEPIIPNDYSFRRGNAGLLAMLDESAVHPTQVLNTLLSAAPSTYGELGQAVRRSTHWSELGRHAEDAGERLLMRWMAAETLTRVDEGETLAPKFLAALGFASGLYFRQLPQGEQRELSSSQTIRNWERLLGNLFERLRESRNRIAHAGFREIEVNASFTADERLILGRVLPSTVARLQGLAFNALALGIRNVADMWARYAECILLHRQLSLAADLQGNLLFTLGQPGLPGDE